MPLKLFVAGAIVLASLAAHADTFDVSAQLKYGGTLSGTVTTVSSTNLTVASYDLTASASAGSPGFTFTGFEYGPSDSTIAAQTATLLQLDSDTGPSADILRLVFAAPLTSAGATLTTSSYESEIVAGNRTVISGTVISGSVTPAVTPEPSSIALFGTGLLGLAGLVRKRLV